MSVSWPFRRQRRYLTGMDWAIGTLHHMTRRATGVGNLSQVVLEVEGALGEAPLRSALAAISDRFPLIHGRPGRDVLNLAPYWKIPRAASSRAIALTVVDRPDDGGDGGDGLFAEHVNTPLANDSEHVRFLLVRLGARRSRLGMVFDHRLLDAFGAETFLRLVDQTWQGKLDDIAPTVRQAEPAHLDRWRHRFASGRTVNGFRLRLSQRPVVALPLPPRQRGRVFQFCHDSLTAEQTAGLGERASGETGAPILLPALVARAVAAMSPAMSGEAPSGGQYLMAVSVNDRRSERLWENLFFNHMSFLAFAAPAEQAGDVSGLAGALGEQFFEQVREGIPTALGDAAMLMRICPHGIGSWLARLPFQGRVCSFYFACLTDSALADGSFLGLPIVNLIHTPRVPPPPGLGVCLTIFRGRVNMVLSYLDGVMDDGSAREALGRLKAMLIAPATRVDSA